MQGDSDSITWAAGQLSAAGDGATDAVAATRLYEELRRLAEPALRSEPNSAGLLTTDVVHQAFERLFLRPRSAGQAITWPNRYAFYAAAAKVIRDILVDEARHRLAIKRGAGRTRAVPLDRIGDPFATPPELLLVLHDELAALAKFDRRAARVVELRFFAGLSGEETAEVMEISERTVRRDWDIARLWLYRRLRNEHGVDIASDKGAPLKGSDSMDGAAPDNPDDQS